MARIAFAGLGVMGWPMARHLSAAGHELRLFNRTREKAERFAAAYGGKPCTSAAQAADGADALITCVGDDADVRQVTVGAEGGFQSLADGALFIDHSTVSASLARVLAAENPRLLCVDAPVSGGQAGAESGQLAVMCGGSGEAVDAARPLIAAYGRRIVRIGPAGHGQLAKMANQIAIAGVVQGLSESLHFAMKAGLDTEALLDAIGKGAAQSWQMDNRAKTMVEGRFDFGFAVDLMRKDLGLVLEEARAVGASLPVAALVDQFYADVQKLGGARDDTSSLIRRLA
ncbi:NAD(P)-dependent oxidoreductase [Sandaracinobacter sp. RS1-74]|uniref:NAD(P)-dependent oxidoreductase n=1 Tax=Sandaracinobacteroides sayramensis TaxID=2913411 RepID=UPI001EDBD8D6|nr:NAD(P)-dependent oxidoreductase [Sandaracinobacteroides sayramensis]MCG2840019.1 NAD(P)-dependent oxidoreductase [Sandaracinobacteroides sayramensis]